jgi:Gpi18-like mannosyltransferase
MKIAAFFVKNVLLAGLIVSNLSFLAACLILVKLVKLEYGQQVGLDSLASMFFFPTAFILSGVFSESLYLALALACFYFAKKEKWSLTGICGFFLSLSRPEGFLIAIPLFYLYLKQRKFSFLNIKPNALFLFLIPLGLFTFLAYTHYRIGDWFAYVYAKRYWEAGLFNPFDNISYALFQSHNVAYIFGVSFFLAIIILLTSYYRFIGFAYWFFGA